MNHNKGQRVLLEVAIASVNDILAAQSRGADRLEFDAAFFSRRVCRSGVHDEKKKSKVARQPLLY